jgi:ferric-dicitrate binding protein FerR (iron transport regulator)
MKQIVDKNISGLIVGFFAGELNDDRLNRLNSWLDEDAMHVEEFNRMYSIWILTHSKTGKKKFVNRLNWEDMEEKINRTTSGNGGRGWIRYITPVRYAASLFACLLLGGFIATNLQTKPTDNEIALVNETTVNVPLGSKGNIVLPDSSVVWLNAGSTVTYRSDFGKESRDLHLSGEAFFNVRSDSVKPFNVHVPGMTIKALGTRFNVRAYHDDNAVTTTLEEGIVNVLIPSPQVNARVQSVRLKPKEQLVVHKTQAKENVRTSDDRKATAEVPKEDSQDARITEIKISSNVKTELSTSWKDKKWMINDVPLNTFVTDLERRYNLNIRFATEELKRYKFSGVIEDETVEQILMALSIAAPVNYKFDKNNVLLTLDKNTKDKFDKVLNQRR